MVYYNFLMQTVFPYLCNGNDVLNEQDLLYGGHLTHQNLSCSGFGQVKSESIIFLSSLRWGKLKESFARSACQNGHLILYNGCSHSEHIFESNTHCYFSMKYWRNW